MKKTFATSSLTASVLALCAGLALPGPAAAQLATDLICRGCVGARDIGRNAVRSKHIANGAVRPADLNKRAKPAAVASSASPSGAPLPVGTTATTVRAATIQLPGPGAVIATGNALMTNATTGVLCKIDTLQTAATPTDLFAGLKTSGTDYGTVTAHRVFQSAAGSFTAYFMCNSVAGVVGAYSPILSLVYVPGAQSVAEAGLAASGAVPAAASLPQ